MEVAELEAKEVAEIEGAMAEMDMAAAAGEATVVAELATVA